MKCCQWENVTCAQVFRGSCTLTRNAACVCLWENVSFAYFFRGLYAQLKCCWCVCGRMYHVYVFLGGRRLIEILLVCLWENVSCAHVFKWFCTLNWNAAYVSVEESIMCTCFCVGFVAYLKCCLCVFGRMYHLHEFKGVIRLIDMLLVCRIRRTNSKWCSYWIEP